MADDIEGQRHKRTALILYGSETGNSQDVAEELGRVAERLHFATRISEMDLVTMNELLNYKIVIFAISTTGQGEFPKNSREFWKSLLRKRLPPGCLDHVSFTTFGLGDSSYPQFNWSARKLHKRLSQLGAKEIYHRGEGDEQHEEGIDGAFLPWSLDLRKHLLSLYPLSDGVSPLAADAILPFKYHLVLVSDQDQSHALRSSSALGDPPPRKMNLEHDDYNDPPIKGTTFASGRVDTDFPPSDRLGVPGGYTAKIVQNKRVTPDSHWQDVRKLTFTIKPSEVGYSYHQNCCHAVDENWKRRECIPNCVEQYLPGDIVTIYPKNFPEDVQKLISLMGWEDIVDKNLYLEPVSLPNNKGPAGQHGFPKVDPTNRKNKCLLPLGPADLGIDRITQYIPNFFPFEESATRTLRQLLIHNLDITAIPKRRFLALIAGYTDDPTHKERLRDFSNPVHSDEFFDYATRPRRSMLEVLEDFSTVKIPWEHALSIFPVIRGRQFSIASGGKLKYDAENHRLKIELLVALVKYRTVLKKVRQGLCSRYIASLPVKTLITIKFERNSKFNAMVDQNCRLPIIMIAPGTGVAPCRSLIWKCARDRRDARFLATLSSKSASRNEPFGEVVLFFGNRLVEADFFFQDEWNTKEIRDIPLEVFTAFSRDQREKIYVQDVIRQKGDVINSLIQQGAVLYVCGSSGKMPLAVREALLDVMDKENGGPCKNREAAKESLEQLKKDGRYLQETW